MMKFYLNKSAEEIEKTEKAYDFIPMETNQAAVAKSLDNMCLKAVKEIALCRENELDSSKLEKNLRATRDAGIGEAKRDAGIKSANRDMGAEVGNLKSKI